MTVAKCLQQRTITVLSQSVQITYAIGRRRTLVLINCII